MGKWNACCIAWYKNQAPKQPKLGRIQETHICPTCKTPLDIIFECSFPPHSQTAQGYGEDLNELECKFVGIEDNEPKRK